MENKKIFEKFWNQYAYVFGRAGATAVRSENGEITVTPSSSQWGSETEGVMILRPNGDKTVKITGKTVPQRIADAGLRPNHVCMVANNDGTYECQVTLEAGDAKGFEFPKWTEGAMLEALIKITETQDKTGFLNKTREDFSENGVTLKAHQCEQCGTEVHDQCWYCDRDGSVEVNGERILFHVTCNGHIQVGFNYRSEAEYAALKNKLSV